ncbi:MAG: PEP-utilizing enzyme [Candidatus Micrarchaeota archaeon]
MKRFKSIMAGIKSIKWDNRVQRPGYLQPKAIINEAEVQRVDLTPKICVRAKNIFWVKESNLYDDGQVAAFPKIFGEAFNEDPGWPLKIILKFDHFTREKDDFLSMMRKDQKKLPLKQKIRNFEIYLNLLKKIQRYYIIAVPLTNYCEKALKNAGVDFLEFALPYRMLDMNKLHSSLVEIKKRLKTGNKAESAIKYHLEKFAWIKTAYNIGGEYSRADVLEEIRFEIRELPRKKVPQTRQSYLIKGMQAGIFLRNRMKELSQQIWHAYEPLCAAIAADLSLSREDFLQLAPEEVIGSLNAGKCVVGKSEINSRKNGFAVGFLDGKFILLTGKIVEELYAYYNKPERTDGSVIRGTTASPGKITGRVKIILKHSEFGKLKKGDVLVTPMTTPDFVVIMKKAGAIVTDEGGLSCHAAIVSRELQVPCIVGTKNATKLLKDNDLVEVDATEGLIRIRK